MYGENYDNDIALIQLEKPILYNADVMPLCLPPQDAELTSGLTGYRIFSYSYSLSYVNSTNILYIREKIATALYVL